MSQTTFHPTPEVEQLVDAILEFAAQRFGLHKWAILSGSRCRGVPKARRVFANALRQLTDASLSQIGGILNRDHSSYVHGPIETDLEHIDWVIERVREAIPIIPPWPHAENDNRYRSADPDIAEAKRRIREERMARIMSREA